MALDPTLPIEVIPNNYPPQSPNKDSPNNDMPQSPNNDKPRMSFEAHIKKVSSTDWFNDYITINQYDQTIQSKVSQCYRIDAKEDSDDPVDQFIEKYDFDIYTSPIITIRANFTIYKITSKTDPPQSYALKHVHCDPKLSDKHPQKHFHRNWLLAKEHCFLPEAEIYNDLLQQEMFLVQNLWMIDTKSYIQQHTAVKSDKLRSIGFGIYEDNMFKHNLNETIGALMKVICPQLKSLHHSGYIHTDINSKNIYMNWDEKENKPIKFGFMDLELISAKGEPWMSDTSVGTPARHAPEIIVKHKASVVYTDKFDIYSLGITLIELINGRHPYYGQLRTLYSRKQIRNCEYYEFLTARYIFNMVSSDEVLRKEENKVFKHLIYNMVLHNEEKRYNIDQVMKHKWYKAHCA